MKKLALAAIAVLGLAQGAMAAETTPTDHPHGDGHRPPFGDTMFKKIDTNNDGVITKKESADYNEKRFEEMDKNHDGKLTKEEMEEYHKAKSAEWKAKHDANQDGKK